MDVKENPTELLNKNTEPGSVWVYVNPLTGKHAKTSHDKKLAVFVTEKVGRKYEDISVTLNGMVGYKATWDEMLDIASKETNGLYELFLNNN